MKIIKLSLLNANEDSAIIGTLLFQNGDKVGVSDVIMTVESTKAVEEITAPESGKIKYFFAEGDQVKVNQDLCVIYSNKQDLLLLEKKDERVDQEPTKVKATKKAIALADEMNLDITKIKKTGLIKESDVRAYIENAPKPQINNSTLKENMDNQFLTNLMKDKDSFSKLGSDFKIEIYRSFGALIGNNCTIGKNSVINSKYVEIGENVLIGNNVNIEADYLVIKDGTTISNNVIISTKNVQIGKGSTIINNCEIGGGSSFEKDSGIVVGDDCLIVDSAINTTKEVKIGNRVAISPGTRIFTHQHWHNVFYGGIANFKSVIINDDVHITSNVVIAPGIEIKQNTLIKPNSVVDRNIGANCIAEGAPIKEIKNNYILNELSLDKKLKILKNRIFPDIYAHLENIAIETAKITFDNKAFNNSNVLISISGVNKEDIKNFEVIFDVNENKIYGDKFGLINEIRYVLRKYGLRFKPLGWRY